MRNNYFFIYLFDILYILVEEYEKYSFLREAPFVIAIISEFGYEPTKKELPDDKLSQICYEVMLSELKTLNALPAINNFIEDNCTILTNSTMQECKIKE